MTPTSGSSAATMSNPVTPAPGYQPGPWTMPPAPNTFPAAAYGPWWDTLTTPESQGVPYPLSAKEQASPDSLHCSPGGFVSLLQNGHASFAAPWPPAGKENTSDSTSRCAASSSKAKNVIKIDGGDGVRTEKRLSFIPDEDVRLVSAWLHNSNDPINGNCKKNEEYWGAVHAAYNSTTPENRKRKLKHLRD